MIMVQRVLPLLFLMAACNRGPTPQAPSEYAKVFTDGRMRPVAIHVPVRCVVSLAPSDTEILFAVEAGSLLVGCDDHSDYPPPARDVRRLGKVSGHLDQELILTLKPDLVLASEINLPEEVESLERLGLAVFLLRNPSSFEGLYENILSVGWIAGREDRSREVVEGLRCRVRRVEERIRNVGGRPRVFYELDATDPSNPWTAGPGTFIDLLIRLAGGENIAAGRGQSYPRLSAEEIVQVDPEVIILGDGRCGVTVESVRRRPGWGGIAAVRLGQVHVFDDDLGSRPGPRLVDGLEALASLLHPERMER